MTFSTKIKSLFLWSLGPVFNSLGKGAEFSPTRSSLIRFDTVVVIYQLQATVDPRNGTKSCFFFWYII